MDSLIPPKLINSKFEEISPEDIKNLIYGSKLIALLFTASWCSPCTILEKELLEIYPEANIGEKTLEVIHLSFDRKESEYKTAIANKPWLFVPFNDNFIKIMSEKFGIIAVPVLIILDRNGKVVCESGRKVIMEEGIKAVERWATDFDNLSSYIK
jgi:nucleoredoxin